MAILLTSFLTIALLGPVARFIGWASSEVDVGGGLAGVLWLVVFVELMAGVLGFGGLVIWQSTVWIGWRWGDIDRQVGLAGSALLRSYDQPARVGLWQSRTVAVRVGRLHMQLARAGVQLESGADDADLLRQALVAYVRGALPAVTADPVSTEGGAAPTGHTSRSVYTVTAIGAFVTTVTALLAAVASLIGALQG